MEKKQEPKEQLYLMGRERKNMSGSKKLTILQMNDSRAYFDLASTKHLDI